jgi:Putative Ig domain
MDTFVVRVRESGQSEPGLRGVVDEVASGTRSTFHNAEELVMILTGSANQAETSEGGKKPGGSGSRRSSDGSLGLRLVSIAVIGVITAMLAACGSWDVGIASADDSGSTPVWSPGFELNLPSDAQTKSGTAVATPGAIDCTSAGNCVTAGYYEDNDESRQALVQTETGGAWAQPTKLTLPSNANSVTGHQFAGLGGLTCTSPGNCVAVGTYVDNTSNSAHVPMVVAETNGVWGTGQEITQPTDVTPDNEGEWGSLNAIACTAPGYCEAGGSYVDSIDSTQAMVAVETAGTWATATRVTLPAGANNTNTGLSNFGQGEQVAAVTSISCPSSGTCELVGYYQDGAKNYQAMAAAQTGPVTWGPAIEVSQQGGAPIAYLEGVNCTTPGNCVAVGGWETPAGVDRLFSDFEVNGTWGTGLDVPLPANAIATDFQGEADVLGGLSCTSNLHCVAVGYVTTAGGNRAPVSVVYGDDGWGPVTELTIPSNGVAQTSQSATQWAGAGSIDCTSPGLCAATGSYIDGSNNYEPMVFNSLPSSITPVSITTTSLPDAVVGTPYSAHLAATGGSGSYAWSISSDSLPAGLSLDPTTGVISGTPTKFGPLAFFVTATDTGPIALHATTSFSISVTEPVVVPSQLKPHPIAGKVTLTSKGVTITISCSGQKTQNCIGGLSLTTVEHLKKPKKKTKTVTLGSARYSVAGGAKKVVSVALNAIGKKLLAKDHKLPSKLILTTSGIKQPIATKSITVKPVKKAKPKGKH